MTDEFDPYHSWLGIPPRHQPPNHYRLLGVQAFEADVDVIANAADRQMGHVRTYQSGQHEALSQKILNEIAAAKVCLLNPQKKAGYDEQLRGQQKRRRAPAVQTPVVVTAARSKSVTGPAAGSSRGGALRRASSRSKKPLWTQPLVIVAACSLIVVSLIVVVIISTSAAPKQRQEVARREANETDNQPTNRETGRGNPPAQGTPQKGDAAAAAPFKSSAQVETIPFGNGRLTEKPPPVIEPKEAEPKETEPQKTDPPPAKIPAVKPDPVVPSPAPLEKLKPKPKKAPLPNEDAVRAAEEEIAQLFGLDKPGTSAAKRQIASEILQAASEEEQRTPSHFAILRTVRDVAASAGDLATALEAIEQIEAVYDVDAWKLKLKAAQRAATSAGPAKRRAQLVDAIVSLVDPAIAVDRYQIATSLAALAASTARQTRDRDLIRQVAAVSAATKKRQQEFNTNVAPALAALEANADDPAANLLVGKFRCIVQGDWKRGLRHLALGSDSALKNAAVADLAEPTDSEKRAAVGDGWWDLAKRAASDEQRQMQMRARHWYRRSAVGLVGLRKLRVAKRIEQLDALRLPEVENSERAELAKVLRRKEPGKGMIGTVSVDGVDTGILLTYRLGTALNVEKIEAAVAREGIKGKSVQFRFYGTLPLKEDSRITAWIKSGGHSDAGKSKLLLNQRELLSSNAGGSTDNYGRGVYLFLWVSTTGKLNDDALHIITRSREQVGMVYTKQMLATLKASRAKAIVDVSGFTRKEAIEELRRIGATFNENTKEVGVRSVYLNGAAITDDQLKLVHPIGPRDLEIKNCPNITSVGLRQLERLNVITLNMSGTPVGDEDLKHLENKINLWQLNLSGTKVTGRGLKRLYHLPSLRKLWLPRSTSQVSDESVEALQRALPKCKIYR